jgi:hypothetical protein
MAEPSSNAVQTPPILGGIAHTAKRLFNELDDRSYISIKDEGLCLWHHVPAHLPPYPIRTKSFFLGVKRPEHGTNACPPPTSSPNVDNETLSSFLIHCPYGVMLRHRNKYAVHCLLSCSFALSTGDSIIVDVMLSGLGYRSVDSMRRR